MDTMKTFLALFCILRATSAGAIEPIPGSMVYGAQATPLVSAPVGSTFSHRFTDSFGRDVYEVYKLEEERTPTLTRRQLLSSN